MSIDWLQVHFIALDRETSYWRYPSDNPAQDVIVLDDILPTRPRHELFACKDGILAVFKGPLIPKLGEFPRLGATIDRISDTIIAEGMETPVAKKGKPQ